MKRENEFGIINKEEGGRGDQKEQEENKQKNIN